MITRKDVFKEIVNPSEFSKSNDNHVVGIMIYKAIYMCVRLLLDIRSNQVQLAKQMGFKLEPPKDNVPTN
jgi:hypothetical protein